MSRAALRNVHIYDSRNSEYLGGVRQNGSITQRNFYDMLRILLVVSPPNQDIEVHPRGTQTVIPADTARLPPGHYDISCPQGSFSMTDERLVRRVHSRSSASRNTSFRDAVRARDGVCVLSGTPNENAIINDWSGFEAAHVFPLERASLWAQCGFSRLVTQTPNTNSMNSVQNGLLLTSSIHRLFDNFLVSVNPYDGYKIITFGGDNFRLDGRTLHQNCRNTTNSENVVDELLFWHYRQCVLANMRGAGEPTFEWDFPPGTDVMKEIREGPAPIERLEIEISSRLQTDV